jgi:hypothetical protein
VRVLPTVDEGGPGRSKCDDAAISGREKTMASPVEEVEESCGCDSMLDIWITSVGDPCGIAPHPADEPGYVWQVAIYECSGRVLSWCGREYAYLYAPCGHLRVRVPPGRYIIRAAVAMHPDAKTGLPAGNDWTDTAVAVVGCGQCQCVFLYSPTPHWCGLGFLWALRSAIEAGIVGKETGGAAVEAIERVLDELPRTPFEETAAESLLKQRARVYEAAGKKHGK